MADNWYVILELDFDPPVEDEQKIADKIDERAKFWSTHFNDFKMGAQYRAWHQNIPQIKKDMIGAANIRKQLAADACTIVYGPVDKLLKTIGRKGSITVDEGDKLCEKLKISIDVLQKRAAKLGIKWEKDYQAIYNRYYKTKPQNASLFDGMKQMLSSFNVDNLYDFLYRDTAVKNANKLSCETLRQRAAEKKKKEFYKNDSISGTGSKLCGQCKMIFQNESSKKVYDDYLVYTDCRKILQYAKEIVEISGKLSSVQTADTIQQLTEQLGNKQLAEDILVAFCKIENLLFSISSKVEPSKPQAKSAFSIKSVKSVGSNDFHTPFPPGTYSSVIDIEKFKCIYFHIFLQKPVGIQSILNLKLLVYDSNNNLVSDLSTQINCEPIYDKFSQGMILRGDDGNSLSPGKYLAKINFEDSNTVVYYFEIVKKKRKGLFGFFK